MKAIGRKVVIRPQAKEDVTSNGIEIVSASSEKFARGTVQSVGDKVETVKEGDVVFYSPLTFDELEDDDGELHVVDDDDVFAIIPNE